MAFMPPIIAAGAASGGLSAGMGSLLGSGLTAGAGILGGLIGQGGQQATNAQTMAMQMESERFNEYAAWENRAWEQQMSSTAYQRAMDDMKKAGLNPILAANLGGASSPGGSSPSIGVPTLGNPGSAMQAGITSAGTAVQAGAGIKAILTQAEKDQTAADVNTAVEKRTHAETEKTRQDTNTSRSAETLNDANSLNKVVESELMRAQAGSANALARLNTRQAEDTEAYGDSPISKALGSLVRILRTSGKIGGPTNADPNATPVPGTGGLIQTKPKQW